MAQVQQGRLTVHTPNIIYDGPFGDHDMPCSVLHGQEKAVLDMNQGVFHPSWKAQGDGWRLIRVKSRWQKLLFWLAGFGGGR